MLIQLNKRLGKKIARVIGIFTFFVLINEKSFGNSLKKQTTETIPLHEAVKNGDTEKLKSLLKEKVNVNRIGEDGYTALHHAVDEEDLEAIRILLDNGADLFLKDDDDWTPWDLSSYAKNKEILNLLTSEHSKRSKNCVYACEHGSGSPPAVSCRIINGVFFKHKEDYYCAINKESCEEVCQKIKKDNFNREVLVDVSKKQITETIPLHESVKSGDIERIKGLLEKEVNVDQKGENGFTALHWAIEKENPKAVKILLDHGADMDLKDDDDWTPWDLSSYAKNKEISNLLSSEHSKRSKNCVYVCKRASSMVTCSLGDGFKYNDVNYCILNKKRCDEACLKIQK